MINGITRKDIIEIYGVTEGQINFANTKGIFPKKIGFNYNREWIYDDKQIESFFKYHPVKNKNKEKKNKSINLDNIFSSTENNFNRMSVTFNMKKKENKKIKIAMHSLANKYKPINRQTIKLDYGIY